MKYMTVIKFTEVSNGNARHKITESCFIIKLINFEIKVLAIKVVKVCP